jgi:hypothetical protein
MEELQFPFFETVGTDFGYQATGFIFCIVVPCYVDVSQFPHLLKNNDI